LQSGRHCSGKGASFQIDALHLLFLLGMFDGQENVIKSLFLQSGIAK
jgi:hypothetical protein